MSENYCYEPVESEKDMILHNIKTLDAQARDLGAQRLKVESNLYHIMRDGIDRGIITTEDVRNLFK